MTAADHRTIIEKGADYKIEIEVSENGSDGKDVAGYSVEMVIKFENDAGGIETLDTIAGYLVRDSGPLLTATVTEDTKTYLIQSLGTTGTAGYIAIGAITGEVGETFVANGAGTGDGTVYEVTYFNGNVAVVIDKAVTATYATRVTDGLNPFTTEYRYFYSIDITEDDAISVDKDNIRILRGKLAIRE